MKSHLWILNSALTVFLCGILIYIAFSLKNILQEPAVLPIKPALIKELIKKEQPKPKDLKFIYEENDLFGTFRPVVIEPEIKKIAEVPRPPIPKRVIPQPAPEIQFLPALPIKISGIISDSIEAKSQVTIVNTNTKESHSYKVGDKLFDAYVIRIFPKKIILIRSNGQQETIYMYPEDAQIEMKALQESSWTDVVQKKSATTYVVNPTTFVKRINSLAQLIDMLDITSAFSNGTNIGCHIGKMDNKSIGFALGLMPGDLITKIINIAPINTQNRVMIYNNIQSLKTGQQFTIELVRNGRPLANEYFIQQVTETKMPEIKQIVKEQPKIKEELAEIIVTDTSVAPKMVRENQRIRPQLQELKKRDRQAIIQYGKESSVLKNLSL